MVLIMMYQWRYSNPSITCLQNQRIAHTATTLVTYNHGYKMLVSCHAVISWEMNITLKLDSGEHDSADCSGSTSYVDDVEKNIQAIFTSCIINLLELMVLSQGLNFLLL